MKRETLTSAQIRAARGLLDWSRDQLAEESGISLRTLATIEGEGGNPTFATLRRIRVTLESYGIEFNRNDGVLRRR